jgi:hypothetical protein
MGASQKEFSLYFTDFYGTKYEWVRNSFATNNVSRLMTCEQK